MSLGTLSEDLRGQVGVLLGYGWRLEAGLWVSPSGGLGVPLDVAWERLAVAVRAENLQCRGWVAFGPDRGPWTLDTLVVDPHAELVGQWPDAQRRPALRVVTVREAIEVARCRAEINPVAKA